MHHNVAGNGKREGLKSIGLGNQQPSFLTINYGMMKVQRLAVRRTLKRGEMRGQACIQNDQLANDF